MPKMTGAKFLADTVHGYGITHVFFMPYIGPRALMEMEKLGIKRVQTHGEKGAAYMADAYARVKPRSQPLHGAVGGRRESRRRVARRLSGVLAGHRHHGAREPDQPTAPCLSGSESREPFLRGDQIQCSCQCNGANSRFICGKLSVRLRQALLDRRIWIWRGSPARWS